VAQDSLPSQVGLRFSHTPVESPQP
jgi:hypothetical protein